MVCVGKHFVPYNTHVSSTAHAYTGKAGTSQNLQRNDIQSSYEKMTEGGKHFLPHKTHVPSTAHSYTRKAGTVRIDREMIFKVHMKR